jgi:hypothetical protein
VWRELSAELAEGPDPDPPGRLVVVADHEAQLGYLSVAVIDTGVNTRAERIVRA